MTAQLQAAEERLRAAREKAAKAEERARQNPKARAILDKVRAEDKPAEPARHAPHPAEVECEFNDAAQAVARAPAAAPVEEPAERFAPFVQLDLRAELPIFPVDALPKWAGDFAREAAEAEQVPLDIAAALTLGAISLLAMGKARVQAMRETLNLYIIGIDRSGANKSGILSRVMRPVYEAERRSDEAHRRPLSEWEADHAILESRMKSARTAATKGGKEGDATQRELDRGDTRERLQDALHALKEHEAHKPRGDITVTADVTPEAMGDLLADYRTVALVTAEGDEVFGTMGRYQRKGDDNMTAFLKAWKGESMRNDRKGRRVRAQEPTLGVVALAQPKVLEQLRDPEGVRDGKGALGRILFTVPTSRVGWREFRWTSGPLPSEAGYHEGLRRIEDIPYPAAPDEVPTLRVRHDARALLEADFNGRECELRPGGALVEVESFASKMASQLARLAGLLHLAEGRGLGDVIDGVTMERALTLTRYFLAHGQAAFGMMVTDEAAARALKLWPSIVRMAEQAGGGPVVGRELVRSVCRKGRTFESADDVNEALRVLEGYGYLRTETAKAHNGTSTMMIVVNPEATPGGGTR
jgi:hypothetical protein